MGIGKKTPLSRKRRSRTVAQVNAARLAGYLRSSNKENIPTSSLGSPRLKRGKKPAATDIVGWKERAHSYEQKYRSASRQNKRLNTSKGLLEGEIKSLKAEGKLLRTSLARCSGEIEKLKEDLMQAVERSNRGEAASSRQHVEMARERQALRIRCIRLVQKNAKLKEKVQQTRAPAISRLTRNGAYGSSMRAVLRLMVEGGCSQEKVGKLLQSISKVLGIGKCRDASRRTVGRAMLEGGIAAKIQSAHEIKQSSSFTISGDSTSHRHLNFEAKHIAVRAPDYSTDESGDTGTHKLRLLGVDQLPDHSSQGSKNSWVAKFSESLTYFNNSPMARRQGLTISLAEFAEKLGGMNGDHASTEKRTASLMGEWKKEECIQKMGLTALERIAPPELVALLMSWNNKKITEVGGIDAWNALSEADRASRDIETVNDLTNTLGQSTFQNLSTAQQHQITSFLWTGCCMHKDQNSFKGGNQALMAGWGELGVEPPILLPNKFNAAVVSKNTVPQGTENPKTNAEGPTDVELAAFEASTRGGAKAAAIAGALFNNKDDKKGQGDTYRSYFLTRYSKVVSFPQTNNTRFGSHGEAAIELIKHLEGYIAFIIDIKDKKIRPAWTNLEHNLFKALHDVPTLTELCVLGLYMLSVTYPYMRTVRGSADINGLKLGPYHVQVCDHIRRIIEDPDILVGSGVTAAEATLDGGDWEDKEGYVAIEGMVATLPHIRPLLVKFCKGALGTWIRFASEYAPGGLIDMASDEQKDAAWMPATNDVNEGALGALRRYLREKPMTTIHQYNALAMYRANDTEGWMARNLNDEDHLYIARCARQLDSSGIERARKAAQVEFDLKVAEASRQKAEVRRQREEASRTRLGSVVLISRIEDIDGLKLTVAKIDDQLDVLRCDDKEIPVKSRLGNKASKREALIAAFTRRQERLASGSTNGEGEVARGASNTSLNGGDLIIEDARDAEEEDLD